MEEFKLCSDGEFMPVSLPCPPPYSGPYYYSPYESTPFTPEQGNSDSSVSPSKGSSGPPISSGAVAAIIAVGSFIFFFMCLVAWRLRKRFINGNLAGAAVLSSRNGRGDEPSGEFLVSNGEVIVNMIGCGLEEKLVNLLPVSEYYVGLMQEGKEMQECAVCLSWFEEKEMVRVLPNCHHIFHMRCIDKWFESHANCPLCRERITLQAIQLSYNPADKHDDQQPLHPLHLPLHDTHVTASPPLRDPCVLHAHRQRDVWLPCDLPDSLPLPPSEASASSITHLLPAEAADQAVGGQSQRADDLKDESLCDQNTILEHADYTESMTYSDDAEPEGARKKPACGETPAKDNACALNIRDGLSAEPICGQQSHYDRSHSNEDLVSDRSGGGGGGGSHGGHKEADDRSTVGSQNQPRSLVVATSPQNGITRSPFSLLRKSLSTGCLSEWDAKASHYKSPQLLSPNHIF